MSQALINPHFNCLDNQPEQPWAQLFLAHGAGAGWDHPWLETMAQGLAAQGIWVRRIEFPYAQWMRETQRRRPPQPVAILQQYYADIVEQQRVHDLPCFIGGKSMGGRVATMLAASAEASALPVHGVLAYGYPFHPAKKPDTLRLAPLQECLLPALVVQGTRDPLGNKEDVATYDLPKQIQLHWLEDGDHDWRPRKASGFTLAQHQQSAIEITVAFMRKTSCTNQLCW